MSEVKEAVVREPMIHINWPEIGRRWEMLSFMVVTGLYWLAVLGLCGSAIYICLYAVNLPWVEHRGQSSVHVISLVGLELAGISLLSLVRRQRRAREWSPLLTVFVLLMISLTAFVSTKPMGAVNVAGAVPVERHGMKSQKQPAAKPLTALRKK
jgi:hypothetical protein